MKKNRWANKIPYKTRKRKGLLRSRIFWMIFLGLVFTIGIIYLFIFSPVFQIKEVKVSGNQKISVESLQKIIWQETEKNLLVFKIKNILLIDGEKIQSLIEKSSPLIESAKIKRSFPDILVLEIKERTPVGLWCEGKNCFDIDENGVIFEAAGSIEEVITGEVKPNFIIKSPEENTQIQLGQKMFEKEDIDQVILIQKTLTEKAKIEAKEFAFFKDQARLNIKTSEGWEIYFDASQEIDWQLTKLELILRKEIPQEKRKTLEYIDLRYSKVYYK